MHSIGGIHHSRRPRCVAWAYVPQTRTLGCASTDTVCVACVASPTPRGACRQAASACGTAARPVAPPTGTSTDGSGPGSDARGAVCLLETRDEAGGGLARVVFSVDTPVDVHELEALCAAVGWPRRPLAKVAAALKNSYMVATLCVHTWLDGRAADEGDTGTGLCSCHVHVPRL